MAPEYRHLLPLLAWLGSGAVAYAACNDMKVCEGENTYAFYAGALHRGRVNSFATDGNVNFRPDGTATAIPLNKKFVAASKTGSCAKANGTTCIGDAEASASSKAAGIVMGYFKATGFVVVFESGGVQSVRGSTLTTAHNPGFVRREPPPPPVAAPAPPDPVVASVEDVAKVSGQLEKIENPDGPPCPDDAPAAATAMDQLVARARRGDGLTLTDYLKQWKPAEGNPNGPNPWRDCMDPEGWNHPVKLDEKGELPAHCRPDTLYSWGPLIKAQELEQLMGNGRWAPRPFHDGAIFASESPVGSFGYGSEDNSGGIPIRIKLRPNVKYQVTKDPPPAPKCAGVPEAEARNTVYINVFMNDHGQGRRSSGEDIVLCSSGPIHSWSYGTKGNYDEITRDTERVLSPAHVNDYWSYMRRPDATDTFQPRIWHLGSDKHPFTKEQLAGSLHQLLLMSADDEGKIFYNPALGEEHRVPAEHFSTHTPIWFNQRK